MEVYITQSGLQIGNGRLEAIPRIGDKLFINDINFIVIDVVWHIGISSWVEIKI